MADDLYKSPSFQFYPTDFIADTSDLTNEEVGAYVRLLCRQWTQGSVPSDMSGLARICGGEQPKRMATIWKMVCRFFRPHETQPNALVQKRLEEVRAEAHAHHLRQVENGKRGGRPRKNPDETDPFFPVNPDESQAKANGNPKETDPFVWVNPDESQTKAKKSSPDSYLRNLDSLRSSFADLAADVDLYLANAAAENKTGKISPSRAMGLLRELEALRDEIGVDAFTAGLREANGRGIANKTYVRKCASSAQKAPPPRREEPNSSDKLPTLAELGLPESEPKPDVWDVLRARVQGGVA